MTTLSPGVWPWLCCETLAVWAKASLSMPQQGHCQGQVGSCKEGPTRVTSQTACNAHTGSYWEVLPMSLQGKARYPQLKPHRSFRCWLPCSGLTPAASYDNHSWYVQSTLLTRHLTLLSLHNVITETPSPNPQKGSRISTPNLHRRKQHSERKNTWAGM